MYTQTCTHTHTHTHTPNQVNKTVEPNPATPRQTGGTITHYTITPDTLAAINMTFDKNTGVIAGKECSA